MKKKMVAVYAFIFFMSFQGIPKQIHLFNPFSDSFDSKLQQFYKAGFSIWAALASAAPQVTVSGEASWQMLSASEQTSIQHIGISGLKVFRDLPYVKNGHERQKLDLFIPENATGPLPLIIWIHGGGWQSGSKQNCLPLRRGYTNRGYAIASIGYRLSSHAIFPAQIEDCKSAIRWLRAHAKEYGLDPNRFGVWGSSAGGHLAALVGTTGEVKKFDAGDNLDQSSRVQAVCDFYGPTDFTVFVKTRGYERHARADSPESKLLGGSVLEVPEKAKLASPVTYVSPDDPPFLILHGDNDMVVPINQSQLLFEALKKAGVNVQLHIVKGAGHGKGFDNPEIDKMVYDFFDRYLNPRASKFSKVIQRENTTSEKQGDLEGKDSSIAPQATQDIKLNQPKGLLYFACYHYRDNPEPAKNPYIIGALFNIYWSEIEKQEGVFDWSQLDRRINLWTTAGKKVALRIIWSSSGNWPDPAAKNPTPEFVLESGAVTVYSETTKTHLPLFWDPIYRKYATCFLREVARKFDGDPNILFIDVTPGAETNPYRFRNINNLDPEFKQKFVSTKASDGSQYSHELWLETVKQAVDEAKAIFQKTPLLITLNIGSLDGPEQFQAIGEYCVARGCYVGQNGLHAHSYKTDSPRKTAFQRWGAQTFLYFEMVDASGGKNGSLMDIMKAAERIGAHYLGVYAVDVLRGTRGQPAYDPAYEQALAYGARVIGRTTSVPAAKKITLDGDRWTYRDDTFQMGGILLKPEGKGPFPGLLISHGLGGSAESSGMEKAREFVKWGMVCIAPNYTHSIHSANLQQRSLGTGQTSYGASEENMFRAKTCIDILRSMPEVDPQRMAAYGHSMGGFVTIALAAAFPDLLKAVAITGSGVALKFGFPAPSIEIAEKIRVPFLIIHGGNDTVVRAEQSAALKAVLDRNNVPNERVLFEGEGHNIDKSQKEEVLRLIRQWFIKHGVLNK